MAKFASEHAQARRRPRCCTTTATTTRRASPSTSRTPSSRRRDRCRSSSPTARTTSTSPALLTKVQASKPDFLFLPDYYNKVNLIAQQARQKGITAVFGGGDGWDSPDLDTAGRRRRLLQQPLLARGSAARGPELGQEVQGEVQRRARRAGHPRLRRDQPAPRRGREGREPTTRPRSGTRWPTLKDFQAVSGTITFDKDGNPIKTRGDHPGQGWEAEVRRVRQPVTPIRSRVGVQAAPRSSSTPLASQAARSKHGVSEVPMILFLQQVVERPPAGLRLRADRPGLHDGLRHRPPDQLRPRRRLHGRRLRRLLRHQRPRRPGPRPRRPLRGGRPRRDGRLHGPRRHHRARRLSPAPPGAEDRRADHRDRRLALPRELRVAQVRLRPELSAVPAAVRAAELRHRRRHGHQHPASSSSSSRSSCSDSSSSSSSGRRSGWRCARCPTTRTRRA